MNGRSGDTKTEASQKSLPIDPRLARSLQELWKRTLHQGPQDWVFANKAGRPRGQQNILHRHVRPAALRAGIGKIGWHTFRHSYSTMLRGAGADIKVQQELLRHSGKGRRCRLAPMGNLWITKSETQGEPCTTPRPSIPCYLDSKRSFPWSAPGGFGEYVWQPT